MLVDPSLAPKFPGFVPYYSPATPSPIGGRPIGGLITLVPLAIAARYSIEQIEFIVPEVETLCLKIEASDEGLPGWPPIFYIINVYVVAPPIPFSFEDFAATLSGFLDVVHDAPIAILGDFNSHLGTSNRRDSSFSSFATSCERFGFSFFPGKKCSTPTFVSSQGATIIDFVFVRGLSSVGFDIIPRLDLGHRQVVVSISLPRTHDPFPDPPTVPKHPVKGSAPNVARVLGDV